MPIDDLLGHSATLPIVRFGSPGAFLAVDPQDRSPDAEVVLLLGSEIPDGATEGDAVDVFIHLDSEGRPLATTRVPRVRLGEVAFLEVTACTHFGAFVDWGLAKELLVPFAEQTAELRPGDRQPIGLIIDKTGRLAGTMRVSELLSTTPPRLRFDEWVSGEAWRFDPEIGLFVIVERQYVGLVPRSEPHGLARGERARFRVAHRHPDGKLELSLRAHAHEELENDAAKVLARLSAPNAPALGDRSSPEEIRDAVGLSKKAFKRAVGRLLKNGSVEIDAAGLVKPKR
jgi:predicted RNA-binding protein (virulence factor B family)